MWLYIPSESEVSARVLRASVWELRSPSDDPELWCYASGTATQQPLSWPGWKERPWIKLLSGIELIPSQQTTFTVAWTCSLRAIPASPFLWPESAPAKPTRDTCGRTSKESSREAGRPSSSSKTSLDIFGWDSDPKRRWKKRYSRARRYVRTFERWVTALQRESLQRRKRARLTRESGYSSWPTARAEDSESCGNHSGATDSLTGATKNWATPKANDSEKRGDFDTTDHRTGIAGQAKNWWPTVTTEATSRTKKYSQGGEPLSVAVSNFPTPNASPSAPNGSTTRENGRQAARTTDQCLESVARRMANWKTPRTITGGAESAARKKQLGRTTSGGGDLQSDVQMWATPAAGTFRSGEVSIETHTKNSRPLQEQASLFFHRDETTLNPGQESDNSDRTSGPQLNPAFGCWLMGLPPWWTNIAVNNCGALEMRSFLSKQRSHLRLLWLRQAEGSRR